MQRGVPSGVSLDDEHEQVGVPIEATANLLMTHGVSAPADERELCAEL